MFTGIYFSFCYCSLSDIREPHIQEFFLNDGKSLSKIHAATSMLEKGIQIPVISKTLGHTAPDSINPYLHTDFVHLKDCSISIENIR